MAMRNRQNPVAIVRLRLSQRHPVLMLTRVSHAPPPGRLVNFVALAILSPVLCLRLVE